MDEQKQPQSLVTTLVYAGLIVLTLVAANSMWFGPAPRRRRRA